MKPAFVVLVVALTAATGAFAGQPAVTGSGKTTAAGAGGNPSGVHAVNNPALGKFLTGAGQQTAAMVHHAQ